MNVLKVPVPFAFLCHGHLRPGLAVEEQRELMAEGSQGTNTRGESRCREVCRLQQQARVLTVSAGKPARVCYRRVTILHGDCVYVLQVGTRSPQLFCLVPLSPLIAYILHHLMTSSERVSNMGYLPHFKVKEI
jgi:hypothetical protein